MLNNFVVFDFMCAGRCLIMASFFYESFEENDTTCTLQFLSYKDLVNFNTIRRVHGQNWPLLKVILLILAVIVKTSVIHYKFFTWGPFPS